MSTKKSTALTVKGTALTVKGTALTVKGTALTVKGTVLTVKSTVLALAVLLAVCPTGAVYAAATTADAAATTAADPATAAADLNLTVISPRNVTYRTEPAFIGALERTAGYEATLDFPKTISVLMPRDGIFSSMSVKGNDWVEQGDTIATYTVNADQLAIDEASLALELAETTHRREMDELTAALAAATERLDASPPENLNIERRLAALDVEAAKENLSFTDYNGERNLAAMRERLDELLEQSEDFTITAPISGLVYDIVYFAAGRGVQRGEFLFRISEPSEFQILVSGASLSQLRLGAEVTIETTRRDAPAFPGHVIGNTILIGDQESDASAVIAFDDPQSLIDFAGGDVTRISGLRFRVRIDLSDIRNVLLAPRRAVTAESTYRYVMVLEDGLPKKRYVLVGLSNIEFVHILDGIEAGDELITN